MSKLQPMSLWILLAVALAALAWLCLTWLHAGTAGIAAAKKMVRAKFPTVPQLSTAALAEWLNDTNQTPPLLLDARTEAEYAVSHLPGARRVDPESDAASLAAELPKDRRVVIYCSAGYRSSALAERLIAAGRTNLFNLEGSIFAWANEDRPLESNGKPASTVHPYSAKWGRLLKAERRAELPPETK